MQLFVFSFIQTKMDHSLGDISVSLQHGGRNNGWKYTIELISKGKCGP